MAGIAFSSDAAEGMTRKPATETPVPANEKDIRYFYELDRCERWIQSSAFKKVALQFPDELLIDSTKVTEFLKDSTSANLFVLGDTSYGSCCVDEVAAQHYNADSIIHFGRSCLSPTERLPVLLVFGKEAIDVEDCTLKFGQTCDTDSKLILMYDVIYHHAAGTVFQQLCHKFPSLLLAELDIPGDDNRKEETVGSQQDNEKRDDLITICRCRRKINIPKEHQLENYYVLYIGKEGLNLTNLMMNFNKCEFSSYNPAKKTVRKETLNINKALMKRYYMMERAKDAGIVGIVVGTLGVSDYLQVINRLKELIKKAGKKSYTFVVGKLNIAKLANFMEVDVFVLVSCLENSLLDSSEFYKPVVTPMEMELACNPARQWTGDYITDFRLLLPGACGHVEIPTEIAQEDQYDVSLITGKLRRHGEVDKDESQSSALLPRSEALTVSTTTDSAAVFLSDRQWTGLERCLGETPVTKAVQGQKGIAAGYDNEAPLNT